MIKDEEEYKSHGTNVLIMLKTISSYFMSKKLLTDLINRTSRMLNVANRTFLNMSRLNKGETGNKMIRG